MTAAAPGGLKKRSVMVAGHRTSVSLEPEFWTALGALAAARGTSIQALIGAIDAGRGTRNLSSAIRVFVLGETLATDRPQHSTDETPVAKASIVLRRS